jgi:NAD+ diphosphatase
VYTPPGFDPSHVLPDALPGVALVFPFVGNQLVTRTEPAATLLTLDELNAHGLTGEMHYLGQLRGVPCIAIALPEGTTLPAVLNGSGLRGLFFRLDDVLLALASRAFQVLEFDRTHRFCGRCGTPTRAKAGERARECPACSYTVYPRVSPAMMALVVRDREILLARAPHFLPHMYSALAGFVEPGETIEDCVRREVREEVGLEVEEPEYFGSQSWAFPHSLMIAFTARYAGGEITPDPVEIAEAHWFSIDALPKLPSSVSISRRLIEGTVERLRRGEPLRAMR